MFSIGTGTWLAARSAGLHADAEIQVRSVDYSAQNIVVMRGEDYTVERASDTGEYTRLVLAKRLSNA